MSYKDVRFYRTDIRVLPGYEGILGKDIGVNPVGGEVWEVAGESETFLIRVNCDICFEECLLHPEDYICQAQLLKAIEIATSMGIVHEIIYCGKGPYKKVIDKTEIRR